MPEQPAIAQNSSQPTPSQEKKPLTLWYKLSIIIVLISLLPPTLSSLLSFHIIYFPLYPIAILAAIIGVFLSWYFLEPIDKLYTGARLFAKGEFKHRIDIKNDNQLKSIASELNLMAQNLDTLLTGESSNKNQLSTERNKLNTIISSLSEGVIVLNLHQQVVLANQVAEEITGISFTDMANKGVDDLFTITDKSGAVISSKDYAPINLVKEENIKYETKDITILTNKKGEKHFIRLIGSPIKGSIQADLGCILLIHDASPEKELESIQLDFVSMASHELRTPLTSILGYLNVFMDDSKDKLDQTQKESLERILISAQQLNSLIDNLLSVSKVERGAFSLSTAPMDWKQIITKVVQDNQLQAAQKNISLKLELPDKDFPKVSVDPVRITEVINNLLNNAINYTKGGGSITVSSKVDGSNLLTCVKDTGVGIPKEALPHLFTKFFRVSGALDSSSNSKGTGLGLYISKSVIDLHKGKIWAESELGKGSNFCFSLPLK